MAVMRPPSRYLAGSFLARFAEEGMGVTMALLALQRTGSVGQAAALSVAWLAPHVLAAPFIGSLAARARRPARFYAGCLAMVAAAMAAATTLLGLAPLWLVCAIAVAGGSCGPAVSGGLSSLVAQLLPPQSRDRGYAWDSATYNAASIGGVGAATAIAALASPVAAGWTLTGAALAATVLIALLPRGGRADSGEPPVAATESRATAAEAVASALAPPRPRLRADLTAGLLAVWRRPTLRAVTAATCLAYLGIGGLTITAVLTARQWGDSGGGILITAFAVGALAGALALTRWTPPIPPQRLAAYCLVVTGVALALAAFAPNLTLAVVLFTVAGAGDGPLLSATLQVRAAHAPESARAQVFTTGAALKLSAAALGAALAGAAEPLPAGLVLALIAATQLAAALLLRLLDPSWGRRLTAVTARRTG